MKRFSTILKYLRDQKRFIALYFIFNLLSVLFSLVSLTMLVPFLQLLFGKEKRVETMPHLSFSASSLLDSIKYILGQLIDQHGPVYALGAICVIIIFSIFLKNLFFYLAYRVLAPMRNRVLTRLRADLYSKILVLPLGFFTEQRKGDLISRMSNDVNEIEWSVMSTLEGIFREPLTILVILATLIFLSPPLSLFLFVLLPLTGFIIGRVSRSLKKQSNVAQEQLGILMSILDETLSGLRVIKAFNAENLLQSKFFKTNDFLNNLRNKIMFRRDMASPMSEMLGVIVLSCILFFGGQMILSHNYALQPEGFIAYIAIFTQIINPAKSLSTAFYNAQRGSAAIKRVEEILHADIVIKEPAQPQLISSFKDSIEFKNVSFTYNDVEVLHNINLKINKGKTVALVGSSGAGKSTLADLIPRFHDVSGGELLVDGVNIKNYSLHSLRDQMSIVTQEPVLFNDTIAANIALGTPDASIGEIEEAARVANAHQFIIQKEDGYETNIGDRGSKLSGGERQRVTIARAVLKNPPILILDEATSSLDTESERLVQDAINNMMQNRTCVVIAHRLSTIRHSNEIIVLQKGAIVERGTHEELVLQNGFYKKLVDMQEIK
ncbi:MAG TPA: antibiotic ABC transporter ATP-binding protein [Chitinophagaceae bacterium]|nr:antibiotic ABC transporter ATP-binding protein [Chitinophagaceae bacterium]